MIEYKRDAQLQKNTFFRIHSLLGKNLLDESMLGKIRQYTVIIGGSSYTPLENLHQLREQFELFLEKLNMIRNPFEQSVFIGVFMPYFQVFMDINKRTSRLMMNLPLLQKNLPIVSFLQIKKRTYIDSILTIYELNDVSLYTDMYVNCYVKNIDRYVS